MILMSDSTVQTDGSTIFLAIYLSLSLSLYFYLWYAGVNSFYYQKVMVLVLPMHNLVS